MMLLLMLMTTNGETTGARKRGSRAFHFFEWGHRLALYCWRLPSVHKQNCRVYVFKACFERKAVNLNVDMRIIFNFWPLFVWRWRKALSFRRFRSSTAQQGRSKSRWWLFPRSCYRLVVRARRGVPSNFRYIPRSMMMMAMMLLTGRWIAVWWLWLVRRWTSLVIWMNCPARGTLPTNSANCSTDNSRTTAEWVSACLFLRVIEVHQKADALAVDSSIMRYVNLCCTFTLLTKEQELKRTVRVYILRQGLGRVSRPNSISFRAMVLWGCTSVTDGRTDGLTALQ